MTGLPGLPEGKWMSLPAEQMQQLGLDGSSADPSRSLEMLRAVSDDVEEAGVEQVRGVETTRYTGTVDVAAALEEMSGQSEQQRSQQQRMLDQSGLEEIPFELFLDEEGRPVRMVQTVEIMVEDQKVATRTRVDMFDWGTEVDIATPDPADVIEAPAPGAATPGASTPGG